MSKHTPGPWEITPNSKGGFNIVSGGLTVAITPAPWGFTQKHAKRLSEKRQNPYLIAAAPELLEALEELAELVETLMFVSENPEPGSIGHKYRAAIAKARGQK